jgi:hypothetical protein
MRNTPHLARRAQRSTSTGLMHAAPSTSVQSPRPDEELARQMRVRNAARKADLAAALQSPGYRPDGAAPPPRKPAASSAKSARRPALQSASSSPAKVDTAALHRHSSNMSSK